MQIHTAPHLFLKLLRNVRQLIAQENHVVSKLFFPNEVPAHLVRPTLPPVSRLTSWICNYVNT